MTAVETSFEEVHSIFDTGGAKGLPGDLVDKIPKITITSNNNNDDDSGGKVCCSVCLQVQIKALVVVIYHPWLKKVEFVLNLSLSGLN